MRYLDLGQEKNRVRTLNGWRVVGRYLAFPLDGGAITPLYMSRTIVSVVPGTPPTWMKHTDFQRVNKPLTDEELKDLTLQIMLSEKW